MHQKKLEGDQKDGNGPSSLLRPLACASTHHHHLPVPGVQRHIHSVPSMHVCTCIVLFIVRISPVPSSPPGKQSGVPYYTYVGTGVSLALRRPASSAAVRPWCRERRVVSGGGEEEGETKVDSHRSCFKICEGITRHRSTQHVR